MSDYITIPIDADQEQLEAEVVAEFQAQEPQWVPNEGNLDTWMIKAFTRQVANLRTLATMVPKAIYRYFGNSIALLTPEEPQHASVTTTWTMVDDAGYTIPQGTIVGIPASGSELVAFATIDEYTVASGATATTDGEVVLVAVDPGDDANDLTGTPELIDALSFVSAIAMETTAGAATTPSGGSDGETDDDYLNRLTEELTLLTPRPILPRDFAILAKRVSEVDRALPIDGYNPGDDTDDNERMITLVPVNTSGLPISAGGKTEVEELLEAMREINFVVHVIDPDYTVVNATFTAEILDGYDASDTIDLAEANVAAFLDPTDWGQPPLGETREWPEERGTVLALDVATVVNNTEGVARCTAATVNAGSSVTLTGRGKMPTAGTIVGTAA